MKNMKWNEYGIPVVRIGDMSINIGEPASQKPSHVYTDSAELFHTVYSSLGHSRAFS